jgi:hypothetical protein
MTSYFLENNRSINLVVPAILRNARHDRQLYAPAR